MRGRHCTVPSQGHRSVVTLSGASRKRAAGTNRQAGEIGHTPQAPRDTSLTGDQLYSKGQSPLQGNQAAPNAVSLCASLRFHSNRSAPHTENLSGTGRVRAAWNPRATRLQPARGLLPRRLLGATPAPLQLRAQLPALPPARRLSSASVKWAEGLLGRGGARGVRDRQVWVLGPVIRAGPSPLPLSRKRCAGCPQRAQASRVWTTTPRCALSPTLQGVSEARMAAGEIGARRPVCRRG